MRVVIFVSIMLLFNMAKGLPQQDEHLHLYEPARLLDGHQKPYNVKTQKVTKSGVTLRSNFWDTAGVGIDNIAMVITPNWRTLTTITTVITTPTPSTVTDSDKAFAFHALNVPLILDWRTELNPMFPPTTTTTNPPMEL
ncbi:uncharacterized protein LOC126888786 [Diabrotica virgifera virgifera]|uniref:Uncharacterized protein LOC114334140 n=1 Tax=Diabrotica virgifera virgifera TaxID=50390 RepID=A0A6P7FU51_DIAVI|nr:uncharacterized protein LOC126888786 [Diabrotica virgifera virgifera]